VITCLCARSIFIMQCSRMDSPVPAATKDKRQLGRKGRPVKNLHQRRRQPHNLHKETSLLKGSSKGLITQPLSWLCFNWAPHWVSSICNEISPLPMLGRYSVGIQHRNSNLHPFVPLICKPACLFVCQSVCVSVCLRVCMSVHVSAVCVSVYLCVCLSVCRHTHTHGVFVQQRAGTFTDGLHSSKGLQVCSK